MKHRILFKQYVEKKVPKGFSGVGIINFEHWYPILRQNWGIQTIYRQRTSGESLNAGSPETVKQLERDFELKAQKFMETTIAQAKHLRPAASWSYYGYPFCKNMREKESPYDCLREIKTANNKLVNVIEFNININYSVPIVFRLI